MKFKNLKDNSAFTPAPGQIGASQVFIKKPNGVCPRVGVKDSECIFWPEDLIEPVTLPSKNRRG